VEDFDFRKEHLDLVMQLQMLVRGSKSGVLYVMLNSESWSEGDQNNGKRCFKAGSKECKTTRVAAIMKTTRVTESHNTSQSMQGSSRSLPSSAEDLFHKTS
jgi:hypothetical protein